MKAKFPKRTASVAELTEGGKCGVPAGKARTRTVRAKARGRGSHHLRRGLPELMMNQRRPQDTIASVTAYAAF